MLGEGWGCASFDTGQGTGYQCWKAGPAPRARVVPWMTGKRFWFLPNRLCSQDTPKELAMRCWLPPQPGEKAPRPMPRSWQWLNPHGATWEDSYSRSDRVSDYIHHGGTFSCLQSTKTSGVFCVGDDSFGQLGGSSSPKPTAAEDDGAFVRGIWPAEFMATGFWHACAFAAPSGMARGGSRTLSPGSDASACVLRDGQVTCWGEAYSAPTELDVPVTVRLEPVKPIGETAMVRRGEADAWDAGCLIHGRCKIGVTPLARCVGGAKVPTWRLVSNEDGLPWGEWAVANPKLCAVRD